MLGSSLHGGFDRFQGRLPGTACPLMRLCAGGRFRPTAHVRVGRRRGRSRPEADWLLPGDRKRKWKFDGHEFNGKVGPKPTIGKKLF